MAAVVVCWRTASHAAARGIVFVVLEALGLGEIQVALIAPLVLARIRLLLHRHGLQSVAAAAAAAAPAAAACRLPPAAWRRTDADGRIWAVTHGNRGKRDASHAERRGRRRRVRAQVVDLGVETCHLVLVMRSSLDRLGLNVRNRRAHAHKFLVLLLDCNPIAITSAEWSKSYWAI